MASGGKLLLIGAGGFVGPWIARAAVAAGWRVTGVARRAPAANAGLPAGGYSAVTADAADLATCGGWVDEADALIFNAAYIPADFNAAAEAVACVNINGLIPLAYLERIAARPRPFIYVSSGQGYDVIGRAATEADPVFPARHATFYLGSKLLGDLVTEHFRAARGVPTTVLRAGSLYGSGQRKGMVGEFIQRARAGERITLRDAGRHQSDLTFVDDVAVAAIAVLTRRATGIFNVGSGRATTALEAARIILAAAGRSDTLLDIAPAADGARGAGLPVLDVTRARSVLGFAPTTPEQGLTRTVREWAPA